MGEERTRRKADERRERGKPGQIGLARFSELGIKERERTLQKIDERCMMNYENEGNE